MSAINAQGEAGARFQCDLRWGTTADTGIGRGWWVLSCLERETNAGQP
jgi:hypothetical protein